MASAFGAPSFPALSAMIQSDPATILLARSPKPEEES
jgi:hypothetical protein